MPRKTIAIVGGGPIGSALALRLSREHRVVLVDAGAAPQKICGEGLLPAAWEVLSELGLDQRLTRRSPIRGISYGLFNSEGELKTVTGSLLKPAYGVQREHLMEAFQSGLDDSNVEVRKETRLRDFSWTGRGVTLDLESKDKSRQQLDCDLLIGADGLHSSVRRKADLQSTRPRRYARWGARCYFRSEEVRERVCVTLGAGLESYLTPLGGKLFGLAFLWSPNSLGRPLPGTGEVWRRLFALMGPRFSEVLPEPSGDFWGDDRAIGPLQQPVISPLHPSGRVALVGDAAGYLDALTGEGLCLGLRQARSLSNCILEGRLSDYPNEHRALKRRHQWTVSGLLWLIHQPKLRERVFRALHRTPEQFSAVLRFAVEEAGWSTLLSRHLLRFLRELLSP